MLSAAGSSPRPWGTRPLPDLRRQGPRFIPTPVGNAARPAGLPGSGSVHPHARGERLRVKDRSQYHHGSSPRPWGTQQERKTRIMVMRFIPTPVGNAGPKKKPGEGRAVHPHARGERLGLRTDLDSPAGSSPRPWGTPGEPSAHPGHGRFIPTPVGNAWDPDPVPGPAYGSSPRPWGTPTAARCGSGACRFIPTPVGNALILSH